MGGSGVGGKSSSGLGMIGSGLGVAGGVTSTFTTVLSKGGGV